MPILRLFWLCYKNVRTENLALQGFELCHRAKDLIDFGADYLRS
ncbi:hypothetical protein [Chlorogloea sp. CCALA 695]